MSPPGAGAAAPQRAPSPTAAAALALAHEGGAQAAADGSSAGSHHCSASSLEGGGTVGGQEAPGTAGTAADAQRTPRGLKGERVPPSLFVRMSGSGWLLPFHCGVGKFISGMGTGNA